MTFALPFQLSPPGNWQDFESLCRDLWSELWDDPNAQKHGRNGQQQQGVDVYGQRKRGSKWCGVQCKRKGTWPPQSLDIEEVRTEVRNAKSFEPALSEFCIATTAPRDAAVQAEARRLTDEHHERGLFSVHIYFWEDIVDELSRHQAIVSTYYPFLRPTQDSSSLVRSLGSHATRHATGERDVVQEIVNFPYAVHVSGARRDTGDAAQELELDVEAVSNLLAEWQLRLNARSGQAAPPAKPGASARRREKPRVSIIPPAYLEILGIVAVSPIAFSTATMKRLFPKLNWARAIPYLKRKRVLEARDQRLVTEPTCRRQLLRREIDKEPYLNAWIESLESLAHHPDTALLLGVQYVRLGHFDKAIEVLSDVGQALDEGRWNAAYADILRTMDDRRVWRRVDSRLRLPFYNAVGLCLAGSGAAQDAISWFLRLRRYSRRIADDWGLGQSFINAGGAYHQVGNEDQARVEYENAVGHARRTKDLLLLGRAACNLAVTLGPDDPERAQKLLEESTAAKRESHDPAGLAAVLHARGILEIHQGRLRQAVHWFEKASAEARRTGHLHHHCLALISLSAAHLESGEADKALKGYSKAIRQAESLEYPDVIIQAEGGRALALMGLGRYKRAESCFRRLFDLNQRRGTRESAAIALHDVGAMLQRRKKWPEARRTLARAGKLARRCQSSEWEYQCLSDIAMTYLAESKPSHALRSWRRSATAAESRRCLDVAGRLWSDLAVHAAGNPSGIPGGNEAYSRAVTCLRRSRRYRNLRLDLDERMYACTWEIGDFARSIDFLRKLLRATAGPQNADRHGRVQDQLGMCLQELGRFGEAEEHHRTALRIAKRTDDQFLHTNVLNNLGELLRKTGRFKQAITLLEESEKTANRRDDVEAAIQAAHNRALALQHLNRLSEADRTLRVCRSTARRRCLWHEYLQAIHGLANLAWAQGNASTALRRYQKALEVSEQHLLSSGLVPLRLNYSNALFWQNKIKAALAIIEPIAGEFENRPNAYVYHRHLGMLYTKTGNAAAAETEWLAALHSATAVGAGDTIAAAAGALAEVYEDASQPGPVEEYAALALKYEDDPECRILLFKLRLRALSELRKPRKAQAAFGEAQRLAVEHGLADEHVDLLVTVGDCNWANPGAQREAMRRYVFAMLLRDGKGENHIFDIGMHVLNRLCALPEKRAMQRIRSLHRATARWVHHEFALDPQDDACAMLLWPFAVAETMVTKGVKLDDLPGREIWKIAMGAISARRNGT